ncbi:MAG: nickel-dependent lactate racemase [Candidatus Korarchaeum sp.]|nr:nickel-dependent lactate racemase [Candidatus Korarchaeum sp.]MDW8035651.1 nickel-dependent lactate racemase [Candidatus Korarchaeum sp.]
MKVSVLYGSERVWFELPDDRYIGSFGVEEPEGFDERSILERSLENPVGPKLEELDAKKALISVNDATRLIPTPRLLDHILKRVKAELKVIVATGSHRAPTEEEYRSSILGHHYDSLRRVTLAHDAKKSDFVDLGTTSRGTPILVNKEVFEHDLLITLSSVEPHYFAGYSGGRKMIAPGLCMYETIERNHKLALLPEAALGRLEGNPVHEDLEEIAKAVANEISVFSVNTAVSGEGKVWAAESGDLFDSFYAIIRRVEENYAVKLPEEPEVVVAVAPKQMGIDLYQAQKAIEAAKLVTKKGGIVILVAPCWDGIGPRNFYDLLTSEPIEGVKRKIWEEYKLGYHKAAKLIEALENYRILAVTSLEDEVLRRIGIEPFRSVQEAVNEALSSVNGSIAVLPEASVCVPRVSKRD